MSSASWPSLTLETTRATACVGGSSNSHGAGRTHRVGRLVARLAGSLAVVLAVAAVLVVAYTPFAAPDYGPTRPRTLTATR